MKNIVEVLRQKEAELQRLQGEVEALRVAIRILSDEPENSGRALAPSGSSPDLRAKEIVPVSDAATRQFP